MKVSVLGLGKLGACYAAFFASKGFNVVGVDTDNTKVEKLNLGEAPVEETNLANYILKNRARLSATGSVEVAVKNSAATFVIVPTPSNKDGSFSLSFAHSAFESIGRTLKTKRGYHLVCLVSTVLPGDSRELINTLEESSGKKCGKDFGYCYNPSLIALGDVIRNLENPDFLFLGAFDKKAENLLARIYKIAYPDILPERMTIESAELAKIALNSFVTMKITFANVLGQLSSRIPHADVDQITKALGKDKRIGNKYLSSGLGYGGPCFPRDNFAFAYVARKRSMKTPLALATHEINESLPKTFTKLTHIAGKERKAKTVGFLGISYKPNTKIAEASQALTIAKNLQKKGYKLHIYEPDTSEARRLLGERATYHESLETLVQASDLLFISNRDANFMELPKIVSKSKRKHVIVDPWRMFDTKDFKPNVTYLGLGKN